MDIAVKVMEQARDARARYEECKVTFIAGIQEGCPTYAIERYGNDVSRFQYWYELWHRLNSWAQREDESGDIGQWLPKAIEEITDEVMHGTSCGSSTCQFSNAIERSKQQARVEVRRVLRRMLAQVEA